MAQVNGIGGFFFRSNDPTALSEWYATHLGVTGQSGAPWQQEAGYTVFAPFPKDTAYFGRDSQGWMLNFRVDDLDAMLAQLDAVGITAEQRAEWDAQGIGRFARIHDPEGNPIELWEPAQP